MSAREVTTLEQQRLREQHLAGQTEQDTDTKASPSEAKELQRKVAALVKNLPKEMQEDEMPEIAPDLDAEEGLDDFGKLDPSAPSPLEAPNTFFKGLKFLLSREVPHESLEFVILCGGGQVVMQKTGTSWSEFDSDASITVHPCVLV